MDGLPPPPYSRHDPHASSANSPVHEIAAYVAPIASVPVASYSTNTVTGGSSQTQLQTSFLARDIGTPSRLASAEHRIIANDDLVQSGFVSAAPYFQMRWHDGPPPADIVPHHVVITADTTPQSLQFPQPSQTWMQRGVEVQDWMTFANYLIPFRNFKGGQKTLDDEPEQAMSRLRLSDSYDRKSGLEGLGSSQQGSFGAGFQSPVAGVQGDVEVDRLRNMRVNAVTAEWNTEFFEPRGLKVVTIAASNNTPRLAQGRSFSQESYIQRIPSMGDETQLLREVAKGNKSTVRALLSKGEEDINALNKKGETALFHAVYRGDKSIVEMLLNSGADRSAHPLGEGTPLFVAAANDRTSIIKLFVQRENIGINLTTPTGETALYRAVTRGSQTSVQLLSENGGNVEMRPAGQESMLNLAISRDDTSIVKLLLARGANTEEKNKDGNTPLCQAVASGQTSVTKLLLQYGARTNVTSAKGVTPLSLAASRGGSSIVALLLQSGKIDVDATNTEGETPLYTAISRSDTSIAAQLLSKGASPASQPPGSESMLNMAVHRGSSSLTALLLGHGASPLENSLSGEPPLFHAVAHNQKSLVALLLDKGADPNAKSPTGETPLYRAISNGKTGLISLLLAAGAIPNTPSPAGETPLYRVVSRSNTSCVSLLLSYGADPNTASPSGESALYRAVSKNETAIVDLLLKAGAEVPKRSPGGESPLYRAVRIGKTSVVELLLQAGARPDEKGAPGGETPRDYAVTKGGKSLVQLMEKYAADGKVGEGK